PIPRAWRSSWTPPAGASMCRCCCSAAAAATWSATRPWRTSWISCRTPVTCGCRRPPTWWPATTTTPLPIPCWNSCTTWPRRAWPHPETPDEHPRHPRPLLRPVAGGPAGGLPPLGPGGVRRTGRQPAGGDRPGRRQPHRHLGGGGPAGGHHPAAADHPAAAGADHPPRAALLHEDPAAAFGDREDGAGSRHRRL